LEDEEEEDEDVFLEELPLAALISDAWVTPVIFAICFN